MYISDVRALRRFSFNMLSSVISECIAAQVILISWYSSPRLRCSRQVGMWDAGTEPFRQDHLWWYVAYTFLPFASFFLLNRNADHGGKRNAGSPGSDDHPLPAFVELRRHETEDRHWFFYSFSLSRAQQVYFCLTREQVWLFKSEMVIWLLILQNKHNPSIFKVEKAVCGDTYWMRARARMPISCSGHLHR